jgi:hypothetical protein
MLSSLTNGSAMSWLERYVAIRDILIKLLY